MKKTTTILLSLCFVSQLLAQGKLKKITYTSSSYKELSSFDKESSNLLARETWDTISDITALRKSHYSAEIFSYGKKQVNFERKNFYYTPNSDLNLFEIVKKEVKTDEWGNTVFDLAENFSSEGNQFSGHKDSFYYSNAALNYAISHKYNRTSEKYDRVFWKQILYKNDCLDMAYTQREDKGFVINSIETYKYKQKDSLCHLSEYTREEKKKIIEKFTTEYKDNFKDAFTRNIYPSIDCTYELIDSMHTVTNDFNQIVFSEKWIGKTYQNQTFFYTPTGKLEKVKSQYKHDSTSANNIVFYHYDKNDSLILQKGFSNFNNKIDSTKTFIFHNNSFVYDDQNRLVVKKYTSEENIDSIVTYRFNCKGFLAEKTLAYDTEKIFSKEKYDYFDDPCDATALAPKEVLLFPNPVSNVLNIKTNENEKPFLVKLYNSIGKEVLSKEIDEYDIDIQLIVNDLSSGVYFIEMTFPLNIKVIKSFIKI